MVTNACSQTTVNTVSECKELPGYVLITPTRNEAAYINLTIESMIAQSVLPIKWIIVSDGSTDGTDEIVIKIASEHAWIELIRMPERETRHFAGKVHAFNEGYARVKDLDFDIIGNLDSDVSFGRDHFEFLLGRFAEQPLLGVAGTAYFEGASLKYDYKRFNLENVDGQCQLFRRKCFEEIGGYVPIKNGGIDVIPVYLARMKGWKSRTFTERAYIHHRKSGTGVGSLLGSNYRSGKKDYYLGSHPLWEVLRCVYQMKCAPYFISGVVRLVGYLWEFIKREEYPVPAELIVFRRKEQMLRLKGMFDKTEKAKS